MAELEIVIKAKDDNAKSTIGGVKDKVGGLVGSAGLGALLVGGALVTGVAAGAAAAVGSIVTIGGAALGAATDFEAATNTIITQLGLTADESALFADIAADVYKNNFGATMEETAGMVALVTRAIGDITGTTEADIQALSEFGFAMQDAFGAAPQETMQATKRLMDDFGLTSQEAMDLLTTGMQDIPADDLLETIAEYGGVMANMGIPAEEFYSILATGAQEGVLGTDKIADAFKEMGATFGGFSDEQIQSMADIGMSYDDWNAKIRSGEATYGDFAKAATDALNNVQDEVLKGQAQSAIFGTMAEDLGTSFTSGLDPALVSLSDMAGASDSLNAQYDNLGSKMESIWRNLEVAIIPIGEEMLNIANAVLPILTGAFDDMGSPVDTIVGFLQGMQPILVNFATETMPKLAAIGTRLGEAWTNDLAPALSTLADVFGLTDENGEGMNDTMIIVEAMLGTILPAINLVTTAFEKVSEAVEIGAGILDNYVKIVEGIKDKLSELMEFDFSLDIQWPEVPEFFRRKSPSEAEILLINLHSGLKKLSAGPTLDGIFPEMAPRLAGGESLLQAPSTIQPVTQGQPNITMQMDGQVVGSIISGRQGNASRRQNGASIGGRVNL